MASPSYTTDLATIVDFDGTSGTAAEPTTGWTAGRSPINNDTDFPIQSSTHASLTMNTTGKAGIVVTGSSFTWTSGNYLFAWLIWLAPGAIATKANGGLALLCGDSASAYKVFYVGGSDFGLYPYGGWQNFAVDPTMSYDEIFGSPSNYYVVGAGANVLSAVSKGNPLGFDAIRYGRGQLRVAGGSSGDGYATFSGMASANDASAARWGLFQAIEGGYKYKGLLYFGYGALTEFVDSNKNIVIDNTLLVASNFNRIEIHNASSVIDWTNISITALGTVSKGELEVIDNADVNFESCTFVAMSTFTFQSNSSILNTTFRSCGLVTAAGANMSGSSILNSTVAADASALNWNVATDPDGYLDDMTFNQGAASHHAIEFGTLSPTTITVRGLNVGSSFSSSDGQTNSTFYVARTSGTVTIYCVGCSGNMTYKSAGATVVIVADPVSVKVTVTDVLGNTIDGARVLVKASNATGPFPYQETVTISNSGTTATVTHTGHGMDTNDYVLIEGASLQANNGVHQITKISDNSYSYTMSSSPGSSPTGTITATFVALYGITSSGVVSTSRVYSSDQPVTGWARKASGSPLYKPGPIVGPVDSTDGLNATAVMIVDE